MDNESGFDIIETHWLNKREFIIELKLIDEKEFIKEIVISRGVILNQYDEIQCSICKVL
tara:strand:+ start:1161 stop:1337 length:177 start_codon:yes stop_codon:yes gene_type:complete